MTSAATDTLSGYPEMLVQYILLGREDQSVDLKRDYDPKHQSDEIAKDICAIANCCELHGCGYIVVGVLDTEQREADQDSDPFPGIDLSMDERRSFRTILQNIVKEHLIPRPVVDVNFPQFRQKRIAIIKIAPRQRPYKVVETNKRNGFWIREGSDCQKADADTVISLFQDELNSKAALNFVRDITERIKNNNSTIIDVVNFLIERVKATNPEALYVRAQLLNRIENIVEAIKDLSNAINQSPEWEYISLYAEIVVPVVKSKYDEMHIEGKIYLDDDSIREAERLMGLAPEKRVPDDDKFIDKIRDEVKDLQDVAQNLKDLLNELQSVLEVLEKTPIEQRDDKYRDIHREVATFSSDISQRHYQAEKRLRNAILIGL